MVSGHLYNYEAIITIHFGVHVSQQHCVSKIGECNSTIII